MHWGGGRVSGTQIAVGTEGLRKRYYHYHANLFTRPLYSLIFEQQKHSYGLK